MKKAQKDLLKRIGFTDAQIATIEKDEDTFDGDAMFGEVNTAIQSALQADTAFIDPLRQRWQGEVLSSKENQILKLAEGKVKQEDIDALPKKDRFIKVVDLVVKALTPEAGTGNKTPDDKDKEILRLNTEIGTMQTAATKHKEQLEKERGKVAQVEDGYSLRGALASLMGAGGRKTVLAAEKTGALLLADIQAEADLTWDRATGQPVLKERGKDVALYDPKDRSKPVSLGDMVTRIGEANGYFVKNNGGGGATRDRVDVPPAQPGKVEPAGMAATRARVAAASGK